MGFFDKFKKDYSMYDCSNRPVSWFMGAEGREAFRCMYLIVRKIACAGGKQGMT